MKQIDQGVYLISPNKAYTAEFQRDGNFVVYVSCFTWEILLNVSFKKKLFKLKDIGKGLRTKWNGTNDDYAIWRSEKSGKYIRIWNGVFDISNTNRTELIKQCQTSQKPHYKLTANDTYSFVEYDYDAGYLDTQLVLCNSGHLVLKAFSTVRNKTELVWQSMGTEDEVKDC